MYAWDKSAQVKYTSNNGSFINIINNNIKNQDIIVMYNFDNRSHHNKKLKLAY